MSIDRNAIHDTGAAKRVIDLAVFSDGLAHHLGDALRIADIDFDGDGVALVVANLRRDFFRRFLGVVGDDDFNPSAAKPAANIRANATRRRR